MEFTVKYRNSDGRIDYMVVDVESRAEVFAVLKTKGISAISVTEGGKIKTSSGSAKNPAVAKCVIGILVLAIVVGAGLFIFSSISSSSDNGPSVAKIAKPSAGDATGESDDADDGTTNARPVVAGEAKTPAQSNEKHNLPAVQEKLNFTATTNANGEVMERWQTPDGKKHARLIPPKPAFDNVIDQTLSIILSVPRGHAIPPMPSLGPGADKEFAKALNKPIEINEDDSEEVKRAKLLVQAGREEILAQLGSGKSVNEIIADHCASVNDNVAMHKTVTDEYNKLIAEGDFEGAEQYRIGANEILQKSGAALVQRSKSIPDKEPKDKGPQQQ